MPSFLGAAAIAFGAVFIAEFGDKSQLLVLAFATRHRARPVIIGLVAASAVIGAISVAVGAAVGAVLPHTAVAVVSGVAFLGVAAWTLLARDDGEQPDEQDAPPATSTRSGVGLVLTVAGTFFIGELGDKTMLVTFGLAATQGPLPTWIGAVAGMVAANLVAVAVGRQVGSRLSPRAVRLGSGLLFAAAGAVVLAGAVIGF